MRPIGNNPGLDAYPKSQFDGLAASAERMSQLKSGTRTAHAGRLEDILAALPVSPVNNVSKNIIAEAVDVGLEFTRELNAAVAACTRLEDAQAVCICVATVCHVRICRLLHGRWTTDWADRSI